MTTQTMKLSSSALLPFPDSSSEQLREQSSGLIYFWVASVAIHFPKAQSDKREQRISNLGSQFTFLEKAMLLR